MWALIEWTEIEASLDIVKRKDILQSVVHEGDVVDVKYEDESSPALILKMNENKDKLLKRLNRMESERRQKEECKLPEKRAIKRKIIFSPENTPSSKIINRFAELLPNRSANKHAVQTSLTSAACSAALQPANSSHLSSSGLDHVEIHKKLNMAKDTFQACGRGGTSWSAMIKDLAVAVFGRSMLATHSLSGKIGNANKESQAKPPLDPTKVELIIDTVSKKFPETPRKFLRLLYGKIE
ncbi:hypothetical protein G5714_001277 [Onychostoma macrolepis]|uniref:BEN domain-containing protein n=1 Tax=Onychostoma macrolepis TaxID=369639 RepID=A0A7J6DCY0_9TELE|nr:hypothetical protein G5714_001277 [Onychostoma macrolepis]